MAEQRLSLRVVPFIDLQQEMVRASEGDARDEPCDQVRYLASYLRIREVPARTLLIESPYVDRHYLEEYTGYYATALRHPTPKTVRIHVFSSDFTQSDFDGWLTLAAEQGAPAAAEKMQASYLGFIVVRPIPAAPVGRTVLAPYIKKRRVFEPAETEHRVHICGIELIAKGVPFQQQDQAVGACATTAIWSALARVMRADGARPVTPLAVTTAATRRLEENRAIPAVSGLEVSQMLDAIREFGYSPHVFEPNAELAVFQLALKCYLRSGIPVILKLAYEAPLEYHAVTVVGFREGEGGIRDGEASQLAGSCSSDPLVTPAEELVFKKGDFGVRSPGIERLYTHDDRLGPYARMVWLPKEGAERLPRVCFKPKEKGFEKYDKPASIWNAIVPLYPKLRLTATDMVTVAATLLPLMRNVAGESFRDRITLDLRYVLSGRYLRDLYQERNVDPVRLRRFASQAVLSRYVGILHFRIDGFMFVDVVCDTTDLLRDSPAWAPVLAMLPNSNMHVDALADHCKAMGSSALVV